MSTPKEAPAFPNARGYRGRAAYPLGGIKTGPAWRAVWGRLQHEEDFVPDALLCEVGAVAGGCAESTVRNILIRAANEGILDRDYVHARGAVNGVLRRRVSYKIADEWR